LLGLLGLGTLLVASVATGDVHRPEKIFQGITFGCGFLIQGPGGRGSMLLGSGRSSRTGHRALRYPH